MDAVGDEVEVEVEVQPIGAPGSARGMPRGRTAYPTTELEHGSYAWISERPADAPVYREFEVR